MTKKIHLEWIRGFKKQTRTLVLLLVLPLILVSPQKATAEPMREFILSCSYGVLAGTLVGAATLAFSDKPGDNLDSVARGASIGLYAGMLLGAYVVYGVPSSDDELYMQQLTDSSSSDDSENSKPSPYSGKVSSISARALMQEPKFQLVPLFSERGLDGARAQLSLVRF